MPYIIKWYVPGRAIYEKFTGHVTLEEVKSVSKMQVQLMDSTDRKVIVIVDQSEQISSPVNPSQLRDALIAMRHPNMDYILTISTANRVLNFLSRLMAQTFGVHLHTAQSISEAQAYMRRKDPSLGRLLDEYLSSLEGSH